MSDFHDRYGGRLTQSSGLVGLEQMRQPLYAPAPARGPHGETGRHGLARFTQGAAKFPGVGLQQIGLDLFPGRSRRQSAFQHRLHGIAGAGADAGAGVFSHRKPGAGLLCIALLQGLLCQPVTGFEYAAPDVLAQYCCIERIACRRGLAQLIQIPADGPIEMGQGGGDGGRQGGQIEIACLFRPCGGALADAVTGFSQQQVFHLAQFVAQCVRRLTR